MKQIFHCSKQDSCDLVFLFNSSFICAWSFALIDYHTVGLYRYVRNYKYLLTFLIPHIVENFDFFQFYFSIEHKIFQNKIFCICSNSLRPTFQFPFNSSRYFKFQTLSLLSYFLIYRKTFHETIFFILHIDRLLKENILDRSIFVKMHERYIS